MFHSLSAWYANWQLGTQKPAVLSIHVPGNLEKQQDTIFRFVIRFNTGIFSKKTIDIKTRPAYFFSHHLNVDKSHVHVGLAARISVTPLYLFNLTSNSNLITCISC